MKQQIGPYINFQGRAREAMELYHSVVGGKLELYAAGEQGAPRPAEPGDAIQHARLSGDGFLIVGSDGHPSYPPTNGDNIAVVLTGSDGGSCRPVLPSLRPPFHPPHPNDSDRSPPRRHRSSLKNGCA